MAALILLAHGRLARIVVTRLILGAVIYCTWQENNHPFNKGKRTVDQVFEVIFSMVRLKILIDTTIETTIDRSKVAFEK